MKYFTQSFMDAVRETIKDMIASIQVKANGTWYQGEMEKSISDNKIRITAIFPTLEMEEATLSDFRILDMNGNIIAQPSKPATKTIGQGVFIQVDIPFFEEE